MFPHTNHDPAQAGQVRIRLAVPLAVTFELRRPPSGIVPGCYAMLRASVPETSVDKHGHLDLGKGNVDRAPRHAWHR